MFRYFLRIGFRAVSYIKNDRIANILNKMADEGLITYEKRANTDFLYSQRNIIARKMYNLRHPKLTKCIKNIFSNKWYKKLIISSTFFFRVHCFIYTHSYRYLYKIDKK